MLHHVRKIMENYDNKDTIDFLKEQFERVNYWLSFGEAKSGALIVINLALMAIIIGLFSYSPVICTIALISLVLSNGVCLWSLLPDSSSHNNEMDSQIDYGKINLLLYSDIAKLSKEQYSNALRTEYADVFKEHSLKSKREVDYVSEIYTNSCIASRKFCLFRKAVYIDYIAMLLCVVLFIMA